MNVCMDNGVQPAPEGPENQNAAGIIFDKTSPYGLYRC